MWNKVYCSARKQGMSRCKGGGVLHSLTVRVMAIKAALVFMILSFLALSFVCEGLMIQSAGATDGAQSALNQEAKVAPVTPRSRGHTILLSSRSRFAGEIQEDNDEEELTKANLLKATKRQHLRKMLARRLQDVSDGNCDAVAVATTFRSAQFRRRMGAPNDVARPLTSRPVKALFILCAKKKAGVRVALASPSRGAPANQHVIPFGNNHRRALKQFPPLPFTRPPTPPLFQIPPLPFTPPAPPLFRFPPLPLTAPAADQLQDPNAPQSFKLPPLPPFPLISMPPLPFQIPPIPCVPSSSGKSSAPSP